MKKKKTVTQTNSKPTSNQKRFWHDVWEYIKEHWVAWFSVGISFLIKKLRDWDRKRKETESKDETGDKTPTNPPKSDNSD